MADDKTAAPEANIPAENKASVDPPQHLEKTYSYESSQLEKGNLRKKLGSKGGMDAELAAVLELETEPVVITEEENKQLLWKIYKRVLLIMLGTYFLQALDKGTLAFASIMGIVTDTGLKGQEYSWLTTIFYLACMINEPLMGWLVQRMPVAKLLAVCITLWGAVLACTAATNNFAGLMAVRFFLGYFESAVQPCFLIMTASWFKRVEQTQIVGLWYATNGINQIIGGILAYGLSHIKSPVMKSWQVLFLLYGLITIIWGGFVGFWLPDSPLRAKCFTEEERIKMVERVRENQTGVQNKTFKREQLWEALSDPAIWFLFVLQIINCLTSGGASAFGQIIVKSFGFSTLQTQLLSMAQGCVTILTCIVPAWVARKYDQTIYVMMALTVPTIIGSAILMNYAPTTSNRIGLLFGFYAILFYNGVSVMIFGLLTRNVGGRTKQNIAIVMVFLAWGAGNCIGPQVFRSKDAPRYRLGFIVYLAVNAAQLVILYGLRCLFVLRNSANNKRRLEQRGSEQVQTDNAFDDLTDRKNIDFVYHY